MECSSASICRCYWAKIFSPAKIRSAGFQTCCVATSVRLLLKQRQLVRRPVSFILRTKCLKELFYGRFLEHADAQDLENFVERSVDIETFFEQRHQRIDAYRHPQLGAHRIGAGAVKALDSQM